MEYLDGMTPTSEYLDSSEGPDESSYGEHRNSDGPDGQVRYPAFPDHLPADLYLEPTSEADRRFARDSFF